MILALAGDTMLGRGVAQRIAEDGPGSLIADDVLAVLGEAELFVLNLECVISDRGSPWPDPRKPFFFRAPPRAVEVLRLLGADCVTLANNHALDFGAEALLDTLDHLHAAGIATVGAGADDVAAWTPVVCERDGIRIGIVGVTDHPAEFAAATGRPGVAYADLRHGIPERLRATIAGIDADVVLVTPHWGPNMIGAPLAFVREAATGLRTAGATLVAGHSAHVFQGAAHRVLFDLGDFIDDYATHPELRNDLGLLFLVTIEDGVPRRVEGVPLALDYCRTRLARRDETEWIADRFRRACADLGTAASLVGDRLVIEWP
ncbi:CapA family protein [Lysinimonas soli]|uniref:CapA family protein n=1 Tax=Lysinimonas soli TaxID=1074233 RepID=A0ABW0NMA3_9MICO